MIKVTKENFDHQAKKIKNAHWHQTIADVESLKIKYKESVFGLVSPWSLIEKLAICIDPTDRELYGVSQFIHTMQVLEAMEKDGVQDQEFLLASLFHDVGKILLLTNEAPENIVCDNGIIKQNGIGLDNCVTHWNHDEFAYMKLKNHIPYWVGWLIRYHSIKVDIVAPYFNDNDKLLYKKYLINFSKYDKLSKSIYHIPKINLIKYQKLVDSYLPKEIEF